MEMVRMTDIAIAGATGLLVFAAIIFWGWFNRLI